jgi:hypothetical protein
MPEVCRLWLAAFSGFGDYFRMPAVEHPALFAIPDLRALKTPAARRLSTLKPHCQSFGSLPSSNLTFDHLTIQFLFDEQPGPRIERIVIFIGLSHPSQYLKAQSREAHTSCQDCVFQYFFLFRGVKLSPFRSSATNCPLVPAPDGG